MSALRRGSVFAPAAILSFVLWSAQALAEEVAPPRLLGNPAVPYPAGATGDAIVPLALTVGADGAVTDARPIGVHEAAFAEAALDFVSSLRFQPALLGGVPVAVELEYRVVFLQPADAAPPQAEPGAPAEEKTTEIPSSDDLPTMGTTIVGERDRAPAAASDLLLDPQGVSVVPRENAEDLLTLAPGVLLRNHHGEGHASAIFLRGFDAGEGQDIEFRLEGVPLNEVSNPHGHGYADTHFILPELVRELRVVEGPFDPAQGDFAVAGSAEYRLGLEQRGLLVRGGAGSFDTQDLLLLWGPQGQEEGTFAGVKLRRGDGFGVNRSHEAATAMAGLEHRLGPRTTVQLVAHSHATRFDTAGVVRASDVEARRLPCGSGADSQFFCTADPNQGGGGSRHGLFATLRRSTSRSELSQAAFVSTRRLRLRENFTGYLLDPRGDDSEQAYEAFTLGARGSLTLRRPLWGRGQELEVGYLARHDDGAATLRRLRAEGGEPYDTVFDNEIRVTNLAAYAATRLRPMSWLSLGGGVRVDSFFFDVTDLDRPTETRAGPREPTENLEAGGLAFQPRGTVGFALVEGLEWLTSAGLGVRSSDAAALSGGEQAPFARVRAAETGLLYTTRAPVDAGARLVGFLTHVDRDLVFDETRSRNVFLGASTRHGALLAAHAALQERFDLRGSLTWAEAHLTPGGGGFWSPGEGPRLPYVPRWVGRVDGVLRGDFGAWIGDVLPASAGVGLTWVGARPLPLERLGEPYLTVDLGARVRWGVTELGLAIENVFDARYHEAEFNYVSQFDPAAAPSRLASLHFAAAPPRQIFVTLGVVLAPDEEPEP